MNMTHAVRVRLSYEGPPGSEIDFSDYPAELEIPYIFFAEDVTNKLISDFLVSKFLEMGVPSGVEVSWTAIDSLPRRSLSN